MELPDVFLCPATGIYPARRQQYPGIQRRLSAVAVSSLVFSQRKMMMLERGLGPSRSGPEVWVTADSPFNIVYGALPLLLRLRATSSDLILRTLLTGRSMTPHMRRVGYNLPDDSEEFELLSRAWNRGKRPAAFIHVGSNPQAEFLPQVPGWVVSPSGWTESSSEPGE
jgi:hypothetical protein